jgi:transposase
MRRRTLRCPTIQSNFVVIGVDIAKTEFVAVGQLSSGEETKARKFAMSRSGFQAFEAWWRQVVTKAQAEGVVFALEPTGHYGTPLATWLQDKGMPVCLVQPLHTNRVKELYDGTRRKTDAKDAAVIADLYRRGVYKPWRVPRGAFAALRVLARRREQLVKQRSQATNRLHRHLDVVFPEIRELFSKVTSATVLALLEEACTPDEVQALPYLELVGRIRSASRGQLGEERAAELLAAAKTSIGIADGVAAHQLAIRQTVTELRQVLKRLCEVEQAMRQDLAEVPYAMRLLSIPKLGVITVATLLGELGDLRGYRHAGQLIKMAGLDLVESSSGQRQGKRHISRRGRRYARQMLYLAALRLGGGVLAAPRHRMVELNKKEPTKAAVANMCRLLRILHALVRDDVDFDAARYASVEVSAAA